MLELKDVKNAASDHFKGQKVIVFKVDGQWCVLVGDEGEQCYSVETLDGGKLKFKTNN